MKKKILILSSLCLCLNLFAFNQHIDCFKALRTHYLVQSAHGDPENFELLVNGRSKNVLAFPSFHNGKRGFVLFSQNENTPYFVEHHNSKESVEKARSIASNGSPNNSFRYTIQLPGSGQLLDFFVKTNYTRRKASRVPAAARATSSELNKVEGFSIRTNQDGGFDTALKAKKLKRSNQIALLQDYLGNALRAIPSAYNNEKLMYKQKGAALKPLRRNYRAAISACRKISALNKISAAQSKHIK